MDGQKSSGHLYHLVGPMGALSGLSGLLHPTALHCPVLQKILAHARWGLARVARGFGLEGFKRGLGKIPDWEYRPHGEVPRDRFYPASGPKPQPLLLGWQLGTTTAGSSDRTLRDDLLGIGGAPS